MSHDRTHGGRHGGLVRGDLRRAARAQFGEQPPIDARQRVRQILRNETGAEVRWPPRRAARRRRWPLQSPACPAPAVRRSCRPARRRRRRWRDRRGIVGDRGAAIRGGHDGVGALEQHNRAACLAASRVFSSLCMNMRSSSIALNNRANSPSCGVRTTLAPAALGDPAGTASPARRQSWSAHRRRAPPPPRLPAPPAPARAWPGPTPPPGPSTTALRRLSARKAANSAAPSTGRTMTARLAAALTLSASRGLAMVTSPAPARSAPRAASRAAPVVDRPPDTTTAWPRRIFVALRRRAPETGRPTAPGRWRRPWA